MRMPPRGERDRLATWIAVGTAVSVFAAGTAATLSVRDRISDRPDVLDSPDPWTLGLGGVLAMGALVTVGACALVLGVGMAMTRSVRHGHAGPALGLSTLAGGFYYALVVGQSSGGNLDLPSFAVLGQFTSVAGSWWLTRWTRPSVPDPAPLREVPRALPPDVRLMWSATIPVRRRIRVGYILVVLLVFLAFWLWAGLPARATLVVAACFAVLQVFSLRSSVLVVDQTGVSLRGVMFRHPPPVPMSEIASAEAVSVSAFHDFTGHGNVLAPDGRHGWITRSGEALAVHRIGKPDMVYTVDGAVEAAEVLNMLVARYEPPVPKPKPEKVYWSMDG